MRKRDDRVGETNIANCGWKMTIIEYRNKRDITVRLENDNYEEVYEKKCAYKEFLSGKVAIPHSSYQKNYKLAAKNAEHYKGMTRTMNCGLNLTITEYYNSKNVVGVWEDGETSKFILDKFLNGKVAHPNYSTLFLKCKQEREGQSIKLKDGRLATVLEYNDYHDVVVKLEDGTIDRTAWNYLESGKIYKYHVSPKSSHIGEVYQTQFGISCTICDTTPYSDSYKIMFEDGYKSTTCRSSLKRKVVYHPKLKKNIQYKFSYLGYTCSFVYSNDTDYYYACSCPKCGFDEILSVKEMVTNPHVCK